MSAKHSYCSTGKLCSQSPYTAIDEAPNQLSDVDCPNCLERMMEKHAALAAVFRKRLTALAGGKKCRVYNTACLNPRYCDNKGACCAGDPNCCATGKTSSPRALCHECTEMVEIVDGKLAPHHGTTGDGCPLNNADAQIYLHPLVVDRIADLEASLVFGSAR